jgi:hypothetical protein
VRPLLLPWLYICETEGVATVSMVLGLCTVWVYDPSERWLNSLLGGGVQFCTAAMGQQLQPKLRV